MKPLRAPVAGTRLFCSRRLSTAVLRLISRDMTAVPVARRLVAQTGPVPRADYRRRDAWRQLRRVALACAFRRSAAGASSACDMVYAIATPSSGGYMAGAGALIVRRGRVVIGAVGRGAHNATLADGRMRLRASFDPRADPYAVARRGHQCSVRGDDGCGVAGGGRRHEGRKRGRFTPAMQVGLGELRDGPRAGCFAPRR